jgi:hypothetical protein
MYWVQPASLLGNCDRLFPPGLDLPWDPTMPRDLRSVANPSGASKAEFEARPEPMFGTLLLDSLIKPV